MVEHRFAGLVKEGVTKIIINSENIKDRTMPMLEYGASEGGREDLELRELIITKLNSLKQEHQDKEQEEDSLW